MGIVAAVTAVSAVATNYQSRKNASANRRASRENFANQQRAAEQQFEREQAAAKELQATEQAVEAEGAARERRVLAARTLTRQREIEAEAGSAGFSGSAVTASTDGVTGELNTALSQQSFNRASNSVVGAARTNLANIQNNPVVATPVFAKTGSQIIGSLGQMGMSIGAQGASRSIFS